MQEEKKIIEYFSNFPYYRIYTSNRGVAALTSWLLSQGESKVTNDVDDFVIPAFSHPLDFIDWFDERFGNISKFLENNIVEVINCLNSFIPGWDETVEPLSMKEQVFQNNFDCLFAYINREQLLIGLKNFIIKIGEIWI